ncbi:hypothetical protein [Natronolimnohabitans innermongolicus]|uniref:hypothetical protein n=1 Tax=Natronolimnohabitans innermongolicus TaxID=253107 RepID=UPI0012692143|nr:hypothetical protein [Natronolimnohabitans innermongolicus]
MCGDNTKYSNKSESTSSSNNHSEEHSSKTCTAVSRRKLLTTSCLTLGSMVGMGSVSAEIRNTNESIMYGSIENPILESEARKVRDQRIDAWKRDKDSALDVPEIETPENTILVAYNFEIKYGSPHQYMGIVEAEDDSLNQNGNDTGNNTTESITSDKTELDISSLHQEAEETKSRWEAKSRADNEFRIAVNEKQDFSDWQSRGEHIEGVIIGGGSDPGYNQFTEIAELRRKVTSDKTLYGTRLEMDISSVGDRHREAILTSDWNNYAEINGAAEQFVRAPHTDVTSTTRGWELGLTASSNKEVELFVGRSYSRTEPDLLVTDESTRNHAEARTHFDFDGNVRDGSIIINNASVCEMDMDSMSSGDTIVGVNWMVRFRESRSFSNPFPNSRIYNDGFRWTRA